MQNKAVTDFSFLKFYKGERKNPYEEYHLAWWWDAEKGFCTTWEQFDTADWYNWFSTHGEPDKFMPLLTEKDSEVPSLDSAPAIFELWKNTTLHQKFTEYGSYNNTMELFWKDF